MFEEWLNSRKVFRNLGVRRTAEDPILIPVVVHIIHKGEVLGEESNLSEAQIHSQIEVINEDFNRYNGDTLQTPAEFTSLAGKMKVQFVLARRDPDGLPTNGIVRKQGAKSVWNISDDEQLKAESYWPAEDYVNIWVCDLVGDNLGYAQFPDINLPGLEHEPTENRLTDGVVVDYKSFGSNAKGSFSNLRIPYDKGRTATHELGHYFGLLHIFGTPGSCTDGDHVDDTPDQNTDYKGCPSHPRSSCGSVDMFQNYMDYTDDACMNIFTLGQVDRMQTVLDFAPRRTSLLNAIGAFPVDSLFYDVALLRINSPALISCDGKISPVITLQNSGTGAITSLVVNYGTNIQMTESDTFAIDSLKSGQQVVLALNSLLLGEGHHTFFVHASIPGVDEVNVFNNGKNTKFVVDQARDVAPYIEKFEIDSLFEEQWTIISLDTGKTAKAWETVSLGEAGKAAFVNMHNYSALGAKDWLVSPALDFSGYGEASMKFRLSYAQYEYYTDEDSTTLISYVDSLSIYVSDDCGASFEPIYQGASADFKVGNYDDFWEPSSDDDWIPFTFDISQYAGLSDVRVAFVTTNGYGNNLYIDDVEFFVQGSANIVETEENVVLFPNPSTYDYFKLAFNTRERQDVRIQIIDLSGKLVQENQLTGVLNQVFTIRMEGARQGVYLVKIQGDTLNTVKKLVISR